jgi:Zn-dependent protease
MEISTTVGSQLLFGLFVVLVVLLSLAVHEFAHAFVANLFGDPTAKLEGRLSLNPIKHWDPVGTTLLVVLLAVRMIGVSVPVFGWGKPVPVDERNFENPKIYGLQTALAGPMSNFLLALLIAMAIRFLPIPQKIDSLLGMAVYLNIFLMFFNLMPIPPLDGSRILRLFLPDQIYYALANNPFLFFGVFFLTLYYLLGYLVLYSQQLTILLVGA